MNEYERSMNQLKKIDQVFDRILGNCGREFLPTREKLQQSFPHASGCGGDRTLIDVGKMHFEPPNTGDSGFASLPYIRVRQLECTSCHVVREYQVAEE